MASERLQKIVRENPSLACNANYFLNFLNYIEIILQNVDEINRENFYRNLKNLKVNINFEEMIEEAKKETIYEPSVDMASYNSQLNCISFNQNSFSYCYQLSRTTNNPDHYLWNDVNKAILHELFHMSSSSYDDTNKTSKSGLNFYDPNQKNFNSNRGLTEGITEFLAFSGFPNNNWYASGYFIESLLVQQLASIVDPKIIVNSYFGNLGIDKIKEELCKIIDDKELSEQLFRNIENNFFRIDMVPSSLLANIQRQFQSYLFEKLRKSNLSKEEIADYLEKYSKFVITSDMILKIEKNVDNYQELDESVKEFTQKKEELLQSRGI
jgi:hypothetical protein